MAATVVTIYVRHSADCKYAGDEFARRCQCRKHLRWTFNGVRYRKPTGTRSWAEAEKAKRDVEDQLSGKITETKETPVKPIAEAIDLFIADKKVQGLTKDLIKKYGLWLDRLRVYCEREGVFTVQGVTREVITGFCKDWPETYPSTYTRAKLRERYKSFFHYCQDAQWIDRAPAWPRIKIEEPPTLPLSPGEYQNLLDAVPGVCAVRKREGAYWTARVRGLFQLMRWSGLAIMDALTLRRDELLSKDGMYLVVTARQKTGTDVSVPIPPAVAAELLAVPNTNDVYFFWSGEGSKKSITGNWGKRFIVPCFQKAGIESDGHMRSHRLRDTFAVDLLEKGVPMEEVSKLLAHESIKTTEKHYAKWVKGRQDRLNSLVSATWEQPKPQLRVIAGGRGV